MNAPDATLQQPRRLAPALAAACLGAWMTLAPAAPATEPATPTSPAADTPPAAAKPGGGLFFEWELPAVAAGAGHTSLELSLDIRNVPTGTQPAALLTRVPCGTPEAPGHLEFGIHTNLEGRGRGFSLTRSGSGTAADVRLDPGVSDTVMWSVVSTAGPGLIGVRRALLWPPARFAVRLSARRPTRDGRWFDLWFIASGAPPVWCGGLRVATPAGEPGPQLLPGVARSVIVQGPPTAVAAELEPWRFTIERVSVDYGRRPVVRVRYGYAPLGEAWDNSDIACGEDGWPLEVALGGDTRRRGPPGEFAPAQPPHRSSAQRANGQ